MKRGILGLIALIIIAELTLSVLANVNKSFAQEAFSDLNEDHWAYQYVMPLANKGVINGYEDGTFKPSKTLSGAEFIKLLVSSTISDSDINKIINGYSGEYAWYMPYYDYANENDLLTESFNLGKMNKPISRVEMARILALFCMKNEFDSNNMEENNTTNKTIVQVEDDKTYNQKVLDALEDLGFDVSEYDANDSYDEVLRVFYEEMSDAKIEELYNILNKEIDDESYLQSGDFEEYKEKCVFSDMDRFDNDTKFNLNYLNVLKIIEGYEDGTFKPNNSLTRAEISKIILLYKNLIDNNKS